MKTIGYLHDILTHLIAQHGRDVPLHIITETEKTGQVEQDFGSVSVCRKYIGGVEQSEKYIVLLPEDFT